jgi:SAM-dependent methyltransferase
MQAIVRAFVEDVLELVDPPDPVVEFGARQVERDQAREADLRPLFAGRDFIGTDLHPGPGVDRIEDLRRLSLADGSVGTAICLETLEHCEDPLAACRELARVVRPGGVAIVSAPFLIGIHAYPEDFFRFTPAGMRSMLTGFDAVWTTGVGDPAAPLWVLAIATRERPLDVSLDRMPRVREAQARWERAEGVVRIGPLQIPPGRLARTAGRELVRLARRRRWVRRA